MPERYNVGATLDRWADSHRTAVISGDRGLTYAELLELSCRIGSGLRALGAAPGDRVVLALDDGPEMVAAFLGCARAGLLATPVNFLLPEDDLWHVVADCEPSVVIAEPAFAPVFAAAGKQCAQVPVLVTAGEGALPLADVIASGSPWFAPVDTHGDDPAFLLYSSGSTGRPKGVVHRHRDIPCMCDGYGEQVLGVHVDDVIFSTSKMYHAYGVCNSIAFATWFGATSVLLPGNRDLLTILATVRAHRPTLFFSVPSLYDALSRAPGAGADDMASVRLCLSAAEALPPDVLHAWRDTFGLDIVDGIGSTELLGIFCTNLPGDVRPGSTGFPVPGYALRLVDENGAVLTGPAAGALQVKGGTTLAGYWRQPERTARVIADGWVNTFDRYQRDEDGRYRYLGRVDDMIKVSGLWVSPVVVENVLGEHVGVREAAAVAMTDNGLTKVKAFVVPRDGYQPDALRRELWQLCTTRLQRHQYPRLVEFVDALPRTHSGKIQRFRLRES